MFYLDLEINSKITKNVFSKIKNYEYNHVSKIPTEKNINNIDITVPNENNVKRKKLK